MLAFGGECAGFQALFERFHQVNDRRLARLRDGRDLLALLFFGDEALDVFPIGVVKFLRFKGRVQVAHQALCEIEFFCVESGLGCARLVGLV